MDYKKFLEKFADFISKSIILTKGEEYYTISKSKFPDLKYENLISYNSKNNDLHYFNRVHILIMMYCKNENIRESVEKYIDETETKHNINDVDKLIMEKELDYFLVGNLEWITENMNKKSIEKMEEGDRLIITSIIMLYSGSSLKITENIPVVVHSGKELSKNAQIYRMLSKEKEAVIVSSETKNYAFKGIVFNAMNSKLKSPTYVFNSIKEKGQDPAKKKLKIKIEEKGKETLTRICKVIDVLSLSEDASNIYYMVQLLSKSFKIESISKVIKKL